MKCHLPRFTFRVALLGGALGLSAQPIVPPDSAVRPFLEARAAVLAGRPAEAVPKLEQALATGHTRPQERFGPSRQSVDYYDPHYWLGRALMELGEDARATAELKLSLEAGVIARRPEYPDLVQRLAELERREAARREAARPAEPVGPPEPTTTPGASRVEPATAPKEEGRPSKAARDRVEPVPQVPAATAPSPLHDAVTALAACDFAGVDRALARQRSADPSSPAPDLLEAVAAATRYVLEGKKDAELQRRARRSLSTYRSRGGSRRAEQIWLSPPLRALLEGP